MDEIAVTRDPIGLGAALGQGGQRVAAWTGRFQNRGPATVYRAHAETKPNPATIWGFRHPVGDTWTATIIDGSPETWLWTASNGATVVAEIGDFA